MHGSRNERDGFIILVSTAAMAVSEALQRSSKGTYSSIDDTSESIIVFLSSLKAKLHSSLSGNELALTSGATSMS